MVIHYFVSCLYCSPQIASGVHQKASRFIFSAPASATEKNFADALSKVQSDRVDPNWKILSDGSMTGKCSSGLVVYVMPGSEFTSEFILKKELFQIQKKTGRLAKVALSDLSDTAQHGLNRILYKRLPKYRFAKRSMLLIDAQITSVVKFPRTVMRQNEQLTQPSASYEAKFPSIKSSISENNPIDKEVADILRNHSLEPIKSANANQSVELFEAFGLSGDRLVFPTTTDFEDRLDRIEEASREIKRYILKNDDELDSQMQDSLLHGSKLEQFKRAKRESTLGNLKAAQADVVDVYEGVTNLADFNFLFLGYNSASDAREAIPNLPVRTSLTFAIWVMLPSGPKLVGLF